PERGIPEERPRAFAIRPRAKPAMRERERSREDERNVLARAREPDQSAGTDGIPYGSAGGDPEKRRGGEEHEEEREKVGIAHVVGGERGGGTPRVCGFGSGGWAPPRHIAQARPTVVRSVSSTAVSSSRWIPRDGSGSLS